MATTQKHESKNATNADDQVAATLAAKEAAKSAAKLVVSELFDAAKALRDQIRDLNATEENALADLIGDGTDSKGRPAQSGFILAVCHGMKQSCHFQRRMELASRAENTAPEKSGGPWKRTSKATGVGAVAKITLRAPEGFDIAIG